MKNTHTFKLVSGPECEVTELDGSHQKLLTDQSSTAHNDRMTKLIANVVKRVGSVTNITEEFVGKMLSCDKQKILVELRNFSLGADHEFEFPFSYVDRDKKKQSVQMTVDISDEYFNEKPVMYQVDGEDVKMDFEEYDEVLQNINVETVLPRSQTKVRFTLLDGKGEKTGVAIPKSQRSSHTPIVMRNPVYFVQNEGKDPYPVKLDLDKLAILDIEHLRKTIKHYEGKLDTEITFEHPEADFLPTQDKYVTMDILGIVAFFFPSGAI